MGNDEDRDRPSDADSDEWEDGSGEALEEMIEHRIARPAPSRSARRPTSRSGANRSTRASPRSGRIDRSSTPTWGSSTRTGRTTSPRWSGRRSVNGTRSSLPRMRRCRCATRHRGPSTIPMTTSSGTTPTRTPSSSQSVVRSRAAVVADGVETEQEVETLRRLGIDHARQLPRAPRADPERRRHLGAHDAWRRSFDHYLTKPCRICVFYRGTLHLAEDVVDGRADGRHGIDWHSKGGCRPARDRPARDPRMQCRRAHRRE